MPKLARSEAEKNDARIRSLIEGRRTYYDLPVKVLAKRAGLTYATYYNRMLEPMKFQLCEIARLDHVLHFGDAGFAEIVSCIRKG